MENLEIKTAIQISRPQKDIFEAIVKQERMSNYFIAHASGNMEEGKIVEWTFPEFPDSYPVKVHEIKPSESIIFEWEGIKGAQTIVTIKLEQISEGQTLVKVTEGQLQADEKGIKWYGQNTEGWANFLACLKAYMEHGINLRKGGFDFMKR